MAFGIKIKKLVTKNTYTQESFYEASKDHEFSIGKPMWVKHLTGYVIAFPELDRKNQVQIYPSFMKEGNKFTIQKGEAVGTENFAKNAALSFVSNGWSDVGGVFGKNTKAAEQQVEAVLKELEEMGL